MAGGMHSRPGRALRDRAAGPAPSRERAEDPVPCWVEGSPGFAGSVLGWRRGPDGGWEALVAAWLPSDHLRKRADEDEAGE